MPTETIDGNSSAFYLGKDTFLKGLVASCTDSYKSCIFMKLTRANKSVIFLPWKKTCQRMGPFFSPVSFFAAAVAGVSPINLYGSVIIVVIRKIYILTMKFTLQVFFLHDLT